MADDLFAAAPQASGAPLTVFRAELLSHGPASWEELFEGCTALRAITFSSSIEFLLRLAERLDDMEVVFGAERILSREHLALTQASHAVQPYGFADALVDHKALTEALGRLLGRGGKALLDRVVEGTLRFRLLRGRPSHEKLLLLSGPGLQRVLTGSANLSLAAFEGRQHEIHIAFDGAAAWSVFDGYYQRDWKDSVPVLPDALVTERPGGGRTARDTPLALEEVPIVRVLNAGVALVDPPARPVPPGFAGDALRTAAALGAELKDLALPKDKAGRTVVNATSVLRVLRTHQARPVGDGAEERIPRAEIDVATGVVHLDGPAWLRPDERVPPAEVARDARILVDYLGSFLHFFGEGAAAVEAYWAFLVWLYAAPLAPHLRQAAIPAGIDPWVYPVYAVLYGRSSGGKTLFTRIAARSMFGFERTIRSGQFTANRALGLRERMGAIPLLIDPASNQWGDPGQVHPACARPGPHRAEMGGLYAPTVLTTNRDVSTIPPDLAKRMVTCHIDAAIPENRTIIERLARRAPKASGTAVYRAYLQRLIPEVRAMRGRIDTDDEFGAEGLPRPAGLLVKAAGISTVDTARWALAKGT